jgi:hypothetical protein
VQIAMTDASDKTIIKKIKNRQFSHLGFLEHSFQDEDKPNHLGYYYFILDLKRKDTSEVFNQVVFRYKDEARAYLYLGKIAHEIYNSFDKYHVAASYYRKAVELDDDCAEAHWGLFRTERNTHSLYRAIHLDYKAKKIKELSHKLINVHLDAERFSQLPIEYWKIVEHVADTSDGQLLGLLKEQLILAHYYLGDYSKGIDLISDCEHLTIASLLPFVEQGHLSVEDVISKVYEFQLNEFFDNEHEKVYQELLMRSALADSKISTATLVNCAFLARVFDKVVAHYENDSNPSNSFAGNFKCNLFYLYSQVHLGVPLDREILSQVHENLTNLADEEKALYFAVRIREYIAKLTNQLERIHSNSWPATNQSDFQKAIKLIELPEVTKHFLHDELTQEIDNLEIKWNIRVSSHRFLELKKAYASGDIENDDLIELASKAIDCNEFDFAIIVIEKYEKYEKDDLPSMTSQNSLGVCYEKKGDLKQAIEYYKVALNLMYNSDELNHTIISNYLSCAEITPEINLPKKEMSTLNDDFNIALIDSFEWHLFTGKNTSRLFKYSPFNINTVDSLTNQYFYLASKNQLNDPIEMSTKKNIGSTLNIGDNYRICCFSNNKNSMLMWSHYAEEHQGVMVEYWFGGDLPIGVGIDKVTYSDEAKRKKEENKHIFNQYLLIKNKAWSYEDEVRLFTNQSEKISYEVFDFPNHDRKKINATVSTITMGYKFPEDKKRLMQTVVTTINGKRPAHEPKVNLREAYLSEDDRFTIKYREYAPNSDGSS